MAKYMIHAVPSRMWYVTDYLIPSMVEQGIKRSDIRVHNDEIHEGNLRACMHAFAEVDTTAKGTWHMQDDVIISHDFKEKTEEYDYGVVCGFKSVYDGDLPSGKVPIQQMWFSMPCIRVPHIVSIPCSKWVLNEIIGNPVYKEWWGIGTNDDLMLKQYLWANFERDTVINLEPNIIDHVDFLIGGTVNSKRKGKQIRSVLWEDEYLVDELKERLKWHDGI